MADKELSIVIKAKNNATEAISSAKNEIKSLSNTSEKYMKEMVSHSKDIAIAMGGVAYAFGAFALNEARMFEKSVSDINTLFDDSGEKAQEMADGMKEILKNVPVNAQELGAGAYNVVSAGISDTSEALMVLNRSAQLSVAGLSTVNEAVNISTSAINAFGLEGEDASKAFDTLQLTVKSGKTNIAELAQSFGIVAPVAATAGISFEELQAATAALTTTGAKASVAQTQLRAAILAMQAPNEKMAEIISKMGYESGDAMLKQHGLVGSMVKMTEAGYDNIDVLKKAFGSVEALGAMLSLTGEQNDSFVKTWDQMTESGTALDDAFQKQTQTFDAMYQNLKNNLSVMMIEIGLQIIPAVNNAIQTFIQWLKENQATIDILSAEIDVLIAVLKVAISTLYNIGKAIGYVIVYGEKFLETMTKVTKDVAEIWVQFSKNLWSQFYDEFVAPIENAINRIQSLFTSISSAAKNVASSVTSFFSGSSNTKAFANGGTFNGFGVSGVVNSPIMGLAGEAGPEAIVPLPDGRSIPVQMKGGSTGINIVVNVQGSVTTERDLVSAIAQGLQGAMVTNGVR